MKKIALVMDGWKRFFTYAWPSGILQRIKESDEEINLYILAALGIGVLTLTTISASTIYTVFLISMILTGLLWT